MQRNTNVNKHIQVAQQLQAEMQQIQLLDQQLAVFRQEGKNPQNPFTLLGHAYVQCVKKTSVNDLATQNNEDDVIIRQAKPATAEEKKGYQAGFNAGRFERDQARNFLEHSEEYRRGYYLGVTAGRNAETDHVKYIARDHGYKDGYNDRLPDSSALYMSEKFITEYMHKYQVGMQKRHERLNARNTAVVEQTTYSDIWEELIKEEIAATEAQLKPASSANQFALFSQCHNNCDPIYISDDEECDLQPASKIARYS